MQEEGVLHFGQSSPTGLQSLGVLCPRFGQVAAGKGAGLRDLRHRPFRLRDGSRSLSENRAVAVGSGSLDDHSIEVTDLAGLSMRMRGCDAEGKPRCPCKELRDFWFRKRGLRFDRGQLGLVGSPTFEDMPKPICTSKRLSHSSFSQGMSRYPLTSIWP